MPFILILEDDEDRITAFQRTVREIGPNFDLVIWRTAPEMLAECAAYFANTALISLDHDLNAPSRYIGDPGDGMDVARFLADFAPPCPVIIHSSNTDRAYSMHNELRFSQWVVDRVGPLGGDWIEKSWLPKARDLLRQHKNTWPARLPGDHTSRVERMMLSLDGLGLGDALGEMLSYRCETASDRLARNELPAGPWFHTDDTEMAISIAAVLRSHGYIHQDALAKRFARRFERDPERGYGRMTRIQLREITAGAHWRETAANAFSGQGSMGNGSAMRIPPLGAYFADDLAECAEAAKESSLVTHTHPEGVAGGIAAAVAAAMAWQLRNEKGNRAQRLFDEVISRTPSSKVQRGIQLAATIPSSMTPSDTARALGNGSLVTAPDTVPFCIWIAAHHLNHYVEALGKTIIVGGDCDTNAAIVGGIVALSAGRNSLPVDWLKSREPVRLT